MSEINETALAFFEACETGKGWDACQVFCTSDASFSAQSGAIADITSLEAYCDWMKGLLTILPDGHYEMKSFGVDDARNAAVAYAVFVGTHTGEGGPVAPTGKQTRSDYVYHMQFDETGKIAHMTKIWNDALALADLGWA
ncbi:MAG: ester cyclase [Pseudomonadota bacterium]